MPSVNRAGDELEAMLDEVVAKVVGVACQKRLLRGVPWQSIVGLAEKEGAEMIVMGTHGRTGLTRLLMGSGAESVVRHAKDDDLMGNARCK